MILSRRMLSRFIAFLCAALLAQSAFAFRSTNVESFTDPDYQGFKPKKIVVMVRNAPNEVRSEVEERLIEKLSKYGVIALKERELFPPTREWTPEARTEILNKNGVDSSLIVVMGASSVSIQNIGTQTFATTNASGTVNANSTRAAS